MPKDLGTGFSSITIQKQKIFKSLIKKQISIINSIKNKNNSRLGSWSNFTFNYIDTTAGVGLLYNNQKGSPLIFLDQVKDLGEHINFNILLIEKDKNTFKRLVDSIYNSKYNKIINQANVSLKIINGDNKEVITKYFVMKEVLDNSKQFGFVYTDPNGTIDYDMVKLIINEFKINSTLDLILNFNLTQAKRNRSVFHHIDNHVIPLETFLCKLNKKYWFIKPITDKHGKHSKWHWHYIIGTNYKGYKLNKGFFKFEKKDDKLDIKNIQGRRLINDLSYF